MATQLQRICCILLLSGFFFAGVFCQNHQECTPTAGQDLSFNRSVSLDGSTRISYSNAGLLNYTRTALDCSWRVYAPSGTFLKVTFSSIDLYYSDSNCFSYVEIREGADATGHLYGKFCLISQLPSEIFSIGQELFITFSHDPYTSKPNAKEVFDITIATERLVSSCSTSNPATANMNIHLTKAGELTSPAYGTTKNYPANMECGWRIIAPKGYIIKVKFIDIDLYAPNDYSCAERDLLTLYDGPFSSDDRLGDFCGKRLPLDVYSYSNELLANFTSGSHTSSRGFKVEFSFLKTVSSGTCTDKSPLVVLSGMAGTFVTPKYPRAYPGNARCAWAIAVPTGYYLKLSISQFSLVGPTWTSCHGLGFTLVEDTLLVNRTLGVFCQDYPQVIYVKGPILMARFISPDMFNSEFTGIRASYEAVTTAPSTLCSILHNDTFNNNFQFTNQPVGTVGTIKSPNYPAVYYKNMQCTWRITAPPGKRIEITIFHVDMGRSSSNNCSGSYFELRDGNSANSTNLGTYCHEPPKQVTKYSSDRHMWLRFHSDDGATHPGFLTNYHIRDQCDRESDSFANNDIRLTSSRGNFTSPKYPSRYPSFVQCTWKITVPKGKIVRLKFADFNLGVHYSDCSVDSLEVRDGLDDSSSEIDKYCGPSNPGSVYSSGNHMWVRFKASIVSNGGGGFDAKFEAVDKGNLVLIIGAAVAGGVVFIVLVGVTVYCIGRKRPRRGFARM